MIDLPTPSDQNPTSERGAMLKTFTKFVLKRRRTNLHPEKPVVEEDETSQPPSPAEIAAPVPEPPPEEPLSQPVWGKVKWYDSAKRYGFIELADCDGDAFLHASAVAGIDPGVLRPGVTLQVRTGPGQRGNLQVTEVLGVDESTAAASGLSRTRLRPSADTDPVEASVEESGTVKWYSASKRFGFIILDNGGKEVFVHASALARSGIISLNEGQRVFVSVFEGQKGPQASSLQIAGQSM